MVWIYDVNHIELGLPRLVIYKAKGSIQKGQPVTSHDGEHVTKINEPHPTAQFNFTLYDNAIGSDHDLGVKMVECCGFAQNDANDGELVKVWVSWHQRLAIA